MLEWTLLGDVQVGGLFLGKLIELGLESWQVKSSDLLVEDLWELVDLTLLVLVVVLVLPEIDLGKGLVGE